VGPGADRFHPTLTCADGNAKRARVVPPDAARSASNLAGVITTAALRALAALGEWTRGVRWLDARGDPV